MAKLLIILFLGGALANTLAQRGAPPPLLIDKGSTLDAGR
jgi:hypothetical protein